MTRFYSLGLCALLCASIPALASPLARSDDGGNLYKASDPGIASCVSDDSGLETCTLSGEALPGKADDGASSQRRIHGRDRFHSAAHGYMTIHGDLEGGRSFAGDAAGNRIVLSDAPDIPNNPQHSGAHPDRNTLLEQSKAPVESRASTLALISQAGDLVSGAGMARAQAATEGVRDTMTFGATTEDSSRYHSGSHIDADSLNLLIGAARRFPAVTGQWMAGVFVEGGYGSYDTRNDFSSSPTVLGSGASHYFGGGLLLRRDWAGAGQAGPYIEGSLRAGQMASDWDSGDMIGSDEDASYDTSALYYGAHLGAGYILPLSDETSLDAHVKGFWTHQNGDSVMIADDPYDFKATDSFRTRLGLRLNHTLTEQITGYVGAAWEHEFDGQARATAHGMDTPSPSLKGDTGVFEIGFDIKPKTDGPLTMGLSMQTYTGVREGFGGTARLIWLF
ncbi:MAG: autotransporter outer membrane beta-barrel domain-containing protein [Castellaniella sp.]|uniref:autotransporter outer membrane beta-barrel domain-containing protein n=1 Tax=Castellaniella sp. TaxID=1955812 RepID=UPI003C717CA2